MVKCEWSDAPFMDDPEGVTEYCTSGKPATFINCNVTGIRVCEDHKCRCKQPDQLPFIKEMIVEAAIEYCAKWRRDDHPDYDLASRIKLFDAVFKLNQLK